MPHRSASVPTPEPPRVSVVIPHYGDPEPTQALAADLRANEHAPLEIIVSDDRSPAPFPETPGLIVVRRETNGGFGSAVNSGAAVASGDLLLILNSDLRVGPAFIGDLTAAAAPWQPCVAGPRLISPDGIADHSARLFPTVSQQMTEWLTPLARMRDSSAWHAAVGHDLRAGKATATVPTDWLVGAALLVPLATFKAISGFDQRYFMNSEEVDLQRRLREWGVPSVYCPTVTATHVGGGSSDPELRRSWVVTSRLTYAHKWGGLPQLRVGLAAATLLNLGWNGVRRLRGVDVQPWRTAKQEWSLTWKDVP
ncbi:MAG: glycosyltransferase family 2 protein [Propionibacteriaceae bacterium]|nr:glycosyltransferase family 2 protein [Micropruina sp.]